MIPFLLVFFAQDSDSARVDRFIETVERGSEEERVRRFDDLRSGRVPYEAIAIALVARPSGDRASVWLVRLLTDSPRPTDEPTAARVLSILRQATPPQGEDPQTLLLFLEARYRWGDPTSSSLLRNLAEDRHVPFVARAAAVEILGEAGAAANWLADETVPPCERLGAACLLARLGDPRAVPFLLRFDDVDLVENGLEMIYEGLAYASADDAEAWRAVLAAACPGNPLLTRTILAALKRVSPKLAREFARAYLEGERASEDPDNDPECRNAARELLKNDERRLLGNVETAPARHADAPSPSVRNEPLAEGGPPTHPRENSTPRWRVPAAIGVILAGLTGLLLLLLHRKA